ncbi:hypothetical protein [uncultured Thiodictyon sp.]|uniref:hypothetical protein n=1 Tax=uncultured Thiodictyon sp. TaxID=1846217 RepID=UPI0025E445EF|nr:hypothetical protein [uncultured Thiodictyon sp.]
MAAQPGRYKASQRELAYRVWRAAGQNLAETLRVLDAEYEWPLAKQTIADWRDQLGWVARAAADDAEERRRTRAAQTDRTAMLAGIDEQIGRYEGAFRAAAAAGQAPDPRSMAAYANLMRLRLVLARDLDAGAGLNRGDLVAEALEWLAQWVSEHLPERTEALAAVLSAAAGPLAAHCDGAGV